MKMMKIHEMMKIMNIIYIKRILQDILKKNLSQVHLIGAKPIFQVRRMKHEVGPSMKNRITYEESSAQKTDAAHHKSVHLFDLDSMISCSDAANKCLVLAEEVFHNNFQKLVDLVKSRSFLLVNVCTLRRASSHPSHHSHLHNGLRPMYMKEPDWSVTFSQGGRQVCSLALLYLAFL